MTETPTLKTSFVIDLSVEELAFLLGALSIPRLPGFSVPDDFDGSAASIAGRSLLARGMAGLSIEGDYLIEEKLAAIVASGAMFSTMLYIAREPEYQDVLKHWVYIVPNLTVMHSKPQPGVERLQTIPDGMSFLLVLAGVMGLQSPSVPVEPYSLTVDRTLIERVRDLKSEGQDTEAFHMLRDEVGDDDFAMAVIRPRQRIGFSISKPPETCIETGMVLDAEQGYWLIRQDGDMLGVTRIDTRGILDFIAENLIG